MPINFDAVKIQLDHPEYRVIFTLLEFVGLEGFAKAYIVGKLNPPHQVSTVESELREEFAIERDMRPDRLRVFENNLRGVARLCNASGTPFIFIAEPEPFSVQSRFDERFPKNELREQHYGEEVWPAYLERAASVCADERVHFYDATRAVSPENFYEPPHFDLEGHEEFGRFLAAIIKKEGL